MKELNIENLRITIGDQEIVRGLTLRVPRGEVHALMGPNGSGKSTLAKVLAGHPDYQVTAGKVLMDGENLLELEPDERARRGLFMAFQYPVGIPGLTFGSFLRAAINARIAPSAGENGKVPHKRGIPPKEFRELMRSKMAALKMDDTFATRYLNDGFSGGEKKRVEILQMAMLKPRIAVLDETDSGLDIDALKIVAGGVQSLVGPEMGALLITHYQRILNYIKPDFVHVFVGGRIVEEGGPELAHELEAKGYEAYGEVAAA